MDLGKYKRALKAMTRPKHLRRVVFDKNQEGDFDPNYNFDIGRGNYSQGGEAKVLNRLLETDRDKFLTNMTEFTNKYFAGNLSRASEYLGHNRNKIKAIYDRQGIKPPGTGTKTKATTTVGGETPATFSTKLKKQPDVLDTFKQENVFADASELASKFGVDVSTKRKRDTFIDYLNRADVKKKNITGRINHYNIGDAAKKLPKIFKRKQVIGESISNRERLKFEQNLDKDLMNFRNRIKKELATASQNFDVYVPKAVEDVGHAVSIQQAGKYPELFKNSNTLSLQSLVFQDERVNQGILAKQVESKYDSVFQELNDLVGKRVTPESQARIVQLNKQLNQIRKGAVDKIKSLAKEEPYFKGQDKRIPLIEVEVPNVGEKFQSQNLKANMSVVDDYYIFGNVNKVNPMARTLADLNPNELAQFESNVIAQNSDNLQKFYSAAGFPKEEVSELGEILETRVGREQFTNAVRSVKPQDAINAISSLACSDEYADGGRVKFSKGSSCYARGLELLKNDPAASKAKLLKRLKLAGGIATEIALEVAFLLPSIAEGKPLDVLIGESTLGLFGLGTNESEDVIRMSGYDPQVIRYETAKQAYKDKLADDAFQETLVPGLDNESSYYEQTSKQRQANKSVYENFVKSPDREIAAKKAGIARERISLRNAENAKTGFAGFLNRLYEASKIDPVEALNRAYFSGGGFAKMGRRGFLKLVAGLAALAAGVKGAKYIPKSSTAKSVINNAGRGTPEWYAPLVDKIKSEGKDMSDTLSTIERETVTVLEVPVTDNLGQPVMRQFSEPGSSGSKVTSEQPVTDTYTLRENTDTGEINVSVNSDAGVNGQIVDFNMTPQRSDFDPDTGQRLIEEGDFVIIEERAAGRMTGPDDYEIELDEFVTNNLDEAASDWHSVEEFATGTTDRTAQSKKRLVKQTIEDDPITDVVNRQGEASDYDFDND